VIRTRLVRFQLPVDLDDLEQQRLRGTTGVLWCEPVRGYCVVVLGINDSGSPGEAGEAAKTVLVGLVPRLAAAPLTDLTVVGIDGPASGVQVSDKQIADVAYGRKWSSEQSSH
jgi:hypothetical protein